MSAVEVSEQSGLMDVKGAAEFLGMSIWWVYAQTKARKLPMLKLGNRVKFRRVDLERWIAERATSGGG